MLAELAERHGTDKLTHGYAPLYEHHLCDPWSILEIGIQTGASLRMWANRWPRARVMGVDINPACIHDDVECHRGDATDASTYAGWLPLTVDVIIDDGSHQSAEVIAAFDLLWPRVAVGGWYVIEDLACLYWGPFGGDENGGPVLRDLLTPMLLAAVKGVVEMHVYEEIAFMRRLVP